MIRDSTCPRLKLLAFTVLYVRKSLRTSRRKPALLTCAQTSTLALDTSQWERFLHQNTWGTSTSTQAELFRTYAPEISAAIAPPSISPNEHLTHMLYEISARRFRNLTNDAAHTDQITALLSHPLQQVRAAAPGILHAHTSLPITIMSRHAPTNRLPNDLFIIAMRRKLRVPLFDTEHTIVCACGSTVDEFGDHFFSCKVNSKKRMHDNVRDMWVPPLQRILHDINFISSKKDVAIEFTHIVTFAPLMRPYDITIIPDSAGWRRMTSRSPIPLMGIDITFADLRSSASSAAVGAHTQLCNHQRHLQTAEKKKIQRAKRISKDSDETFAGEEVNADLLDQNQILIPGAIDQFGAFGPCLRRFLFGKTPTIPMPKFNNNKPFSCAMFHRAYSEAVPEGILMAANDKWTQMNNNNSLPTRQWYGENYIEGTPSTWATQQIGLAVVRCMANHIKYARWHANTFDLNTPFQRSWTKSTVEVTLPSSGWLATATIAEPARDPTVTRPTSVAPSGV